MILGFTELSYHLQRPVFDKFAVIGVVYNIEYLRNMFLYGCN